MLQDAEASLNELIWLDSIGAPVRAIYGKPNVAADVWGAFGLW